MKKHYALIIISVLFSWKSFAQSSTVSPYSQFGLGHLSEQTSGFNRGMNGLGIGLREHNQVNPLNPASYSSIDSLSFIFDMGISGQVTNFSQVIDNSTKKLNANTASLDYVVAGLRLTKGLGMSFGMLPFTNVSYNYSETYKLGGLNNASYTNTYSAEEGGIHQYFLGLGWQPAKFVSLGVNAAYLGGQITRTVNNNYSDSNIDSYVKNYSSDISSYKLDLGLQVIVPVTKKDEITLGATYSIGHNLGAKQTLDYIHTTASTGVRDTTTYTVKDAFALPHSIAAGIVWNHNNKWKVGLDYSLQKWASLDYPVFKETGSNLGFQMTGNYYLDRTKVVLGGEYCQNEMGRKFMQRIRYRAGASYTSPYYKIGNTDGPREFSLSAGFGIPIVNKINNRSVLNISAQWVNAEAKGFIKENTFRINLGLTFNERWFMKWKLE